MTNFTKQRFDVAVMGAGIIGVSVALHLQQRGRSVLLLDRAGPGQGTSFGNAGLIERSGIVPYAFPRDLRLVLAYALNRNIASRIDWRYLPCIAPWLWRFWRESAPSRLAAAARDMLPLIERSVDEHTPFIEASLYVGARRTGYLEMYRHRSGLDAAAAHARDLLKFNIHYDVLDAAQLRQRQPALTGEFAGAIHWLDPVTVDDPGGLISKYAALFRARGGEIQVGDANSLQQAKSGWTVQAGEGERQAEAVVLATGPWSDGILERFGYRFPLLSKRGYHMHYVPGASGTLSCPLVDADNGFVLAPMAQGIRLTTGVEFAPRDSAPTPFQLERAEPVARALLQLGERVNRAPWMGARPCLPDMRPVIGRAGRHDGLWFAFGHNHHGLTLGPVTGRLLAEMMTGEGPFTDPRPYSPSRFE